MTSGPNTHTMEAFLRNWNDRLIAVERRLSRVGNSGGSDFVLPPRLTPTGAAVTDWNLATEVGFYYGTNAANGPSTDWLAGTVEYDGLHGRILQTLHNASGSAYRQIEAWRRTYDGTVWSAWVAVGRQALNADLPSLGAGKDLNTVLDTGWYIQNLSASATLALNYPITRAGHLEVSGGLMGGGADFFMQTYTEYAPVSPATVARQWRRTHYNGTWTAWTQVASAVATLPAPVRYAPGSTHTVAATAWGTTLPGTVAQSITVSQPTWVLVTFGAWIVASAGETRAGVSLGGATVVTPPNYQQDGIVGSGAWGQTLILQSSDATGSGQRTQQRAYLLAAGTTTFTIEAYLATAGTHQVNYPVLEIVPLYAEGSGAPVTETTTTGRASRSTALSMASSSAYTKITGLTLDEPLVGDITFASDAFTVQRPGIYMIDGRITYATNSNGNRTATPFINGAQPSGVGQLVQHTGGNSTPVPFALTIRLAAGDVIDLRGWQSSGATINMSGASMNITRLCS